MSDQPPSCPIIGRNSKGFALTREGQTIPVVVRYLGPARTLFCRRLDNGSLFDVHQSNFTMPQTIPSNFREYNFKLMAPFWADALTKWPKAIVIADERWSPETLLRKLRESRVAHDRYGWKHPLVDEQKWRELSPKLHARIQFNHARQETFVSLGPEEPKEYLAFEAVVTNRNDIFVHCTDPDTIEDFCHCVESGIFEPQPRYIIYGLSDDQVKDLEARYDIGFVKRPDGHSWEIVS